MSMRHSNITIHNSKQLTHHQQKLPPPHILLMEIGLMSPPENACKSARNRPRYHRSSVFGNSTRRSQPCSNLSVLRRFDRPFRVSLMIGALTTRSMAPRARALGGPALRHNARQYPGPYRPEYLLAPFTNNASGNPKHLCHGKTEANSIWRQWAFVIERRRNWRPASLVEPQSVCKHDARPFSNIYIA